MSRTDKTDPFWVNVRTGYYRSVEVHNHANGECNLPPRDTFTGWGTGFYGDCYWEFEYDGRNICACHMCHGAYYGQYGEYSARRDRHKTNVETRRWRDEFNAYGDVDEW